MGDEHHARGERFQLAFQPFDGGKVQMVGRLVQQQKIRAGGQGAGQRRAAGLAAREILRLLVPAQAKLAQQVAHAVLVVIRPETCQHIVHDIGVGGKVRLLRQIAHGRTRLKEARAGIEGDLARGDLQQRGFARAVAADEADALARPHRERCPGEQRHGAEGYGNVGEQQERWGSHAGCLAVRAAGLKSGALSAGQRDRPGRAGGCIAARGKRAGLRRGRGRRRGGRGRGRRGRGGSRRGRRGGAGQRGPGGIEPDLVAPPGQETPLIGGGFVLVQVLGRR